MRAYHTILYTKGYTLIELVISTILLGMLAAVGSTMISDGFTTTSMVDASQTSASQARYAVERLAREIRETKYDNVNKRYCIPSLASSTNLAFNKTSGIYNSDCATNANTVTINYNNSNANLTLQYSLPAITSPLASQVGSFALAYYDNSGATTTSNSAIRSVQISLILTDPSGQKIEQRTRVALRNGV